MKWNLHFCQKSFPEADLKKQVYILAVREKLFRDMDLCWSNPNSELSELNNL